MKRDAERRSSERFTIQDSIFFRWMPWIVRESVSFDDWDAFRGHIVVNLPLGSQTTRSRFVGELTKVFPNSDLNSLPARTWRTYHDDKLLDEVLRVVWLGAMPAGVGRFVTDWLSRLQPDELVGNDFADAFLAAEPEVHDPQGRLLRVMGGLGFLRKEGRKWVVARLTLPKTAFMVFVLDRFAPMPTTVSMRRILDDPFWQYLGGRQDDDVRRVIAEAEAAGLVRHERVDQLDQIATRISLDEFLKRRVRL